MVWGSLASFGLVLTVLLEMFYFYENLVTLVLLACESGLGKKFFVYFLPEN